jgi:type VI secretion system protein ImpH
MTHLFTQLFELEKKGLFHPSQSHSFNAQIKIVQSLSYAFPLSDTSTKNNGNTQHLEINAFGIIHPTSVIPSHYLDTLSLHFHQKQKGLVDFVNIFLYKLLRLYFLAWKKNRLFLYRKDFADNSYKQIIKSFLRIETGSSQKKYQGLGLEHSSHLLSANRTKIALTHILQEHIEANVNIIENFGRWITITKDQVTIIGCQGNYHQLGKDAILGSQSWDTQSKIRICIGPIFDNHLVELTNDQTKIGQIRSFIKRYLPRHINFDLKLIVHKRHLCAVKLSENNTQPLGLRTWLAPKLPENHSEDIILGDMNESS